MRLAAGVSAALAWIVFGITLVIRMMAGNGAMLASVMIQEAPPEATGLPEKDYPGVCAMTAAYLTGGTAEFRYVIPEGEGAGTECFQPHEAAHMEDCRELIRLDGAVCGISLAAALGLTAAGGIPRRSRKHFCRGILWGLRTAAAAAGVLLLWAAVNFDGLFVTFHRVAFRNDGWLLNPRTDLLIRLMPVGFFIRLGIRGLICALAVPALLEAGARIGLRGARE